MAKAAKRLPRSKTRVATTVNQRPQQLVAAARKAQWFIHDALAMMDAGEIKAAFLPAKLGMASVEVFVVLEQGDRARDSRIVCNEGKAEFALPSRPGSRPKLPVPGETRAGQWAAVDAPFLLATKLMGASTWLSLIVSPVDVIRWELPLSEPKPAWSVDSHFPVTLSLEDLWLLPEDLAKLEAPDESRSPRHERELLKCIGALAKLLAEHAPSTRKFGGSKKLPFNQTRISEAVERETGLNARTVAGWLGEAKKLLEESDDDPDR